MAKKSRDIFSLSNPLAERQPPPPAPVDCGALAAGQRTMELITAEIQFYKSQTAQGILEIGRRLIEAKAMLSHGEWIDWLQNTVEFSRSTASRFMQIAEAFPPNSANVAALQHLPYTKLISLLQVPEEEREEFLEQPHTVGGEEKTVEQMTTRELQKVIQEKKAAQEEAARLAREKESYREKLEEEKAQAAQARQRLQELENRPVEVAVRELTEDEKEELRGEGREQIRCQVSGMLTEYEDEIENLKDQLAEWREMARQKQPAGGENSVPYDIAIKADKTLENAFLAAFEVFKFSILSLPPDQGREKAEQGRKAAYALYLQAESLRTNMDRLSRQEGY